MLGTRLYRLSPSGRAATCASHHSRSWTCESAVLEAWHHPESEKLWCEKIDVGEPEPREVATGVRAHYSSANELEGRKVAVVCNLKPAKLAGFASNGMLLCAASEDSARVEFVEPPEAAEPGERICCEGFLSEPATPNQVKRKKLLDECFPDLRVVDGVATYRGVPLGTSAGPCTVRTITSGPVR